MIPINPSDKKVGAVTVVVNKILEIKLAICIIGYLNDENNLFISSSVSNIGVAPYSPLR